MLQEIINFKNKEFITDKDLDALIKEIGRQNLVFEIKDSHDSDVKRFYIIQDREGHQKYERNYKIYLISTDLMKADDFYVSDFVSLIRRKYIDVHYRFDLLYNRQQQAVTIKRIFY